MAVTKLVRIIRTWDVSVDAEYGDTDETLVAKVTDGYLATTVPDADSRHLLPDLASIPDQSAYVPPGETAAPATSTGA